MTPGRKMETTIWEWAEEQGKTIRDLARDLGYSERHVRRIRDGESPVTHGLLARAVLAYGNRVRPLFFVKPTLAEGQLDPQKTEPAHEH